MGRLPTLEPLKLALLPYSLEGVPILTTMKALLHGKYIESGRTYKELYISIHEMKIK